MSSEQSNVTFVSLDNDQSFEELLVFPMANKANENLQEELHSLLSQVRNVRKKTCAEEHTINLMHQSLQEHFENARQLRCMLASKQESLKNLNRTFDDISADIRRTKDDICRNEKKYTKCLTEANHKQKLSMILDKAKERISAEIKESTEKFASSLQKIIMENDKIDFIEKLIDSDSRVIDETNMEIKARKSKLNRLKRTFDNRYEVFQNKHTEYVLVKRENRTLYFENKSVLAKIIEISRRLRQSHQEEISQVQLTNERRNTLAELQIKCDHVFAEEQRKRRVLLMLKNEKLTKLKVVEKGKEELKVIQNALQDIYHSMIEINNEISSDTEAIAVAMLKTSEQRKWQHDLKIRLAKARKMEDILQIKMMNLNSNRNYIKNELVRVINLLHKEDKAEENTMLKVSNLYRDRNQLAYQVKETVNQVHLKEMNLNAIENMLKSADTDIRKILIERINLQTTITKMETKLRSYEEKTQDYQQNVLDMEESRLKTLYNTNKDTNRDVEQRLLIIRKYHRASTKKYSRFDHQVIFMEREINDMNKKIESLNIDSDNYERQLSQLINKNHAACLQENQIAIQVDRLSTMLDKSKSQEFNSANEAIIINYLWQNKQNELEDAKLQLTFRVNDIRRKLEKVKKQNNNYVKSYNHLKIRHEQFLTRILVNDYTDNSDNLMDIVLSKRDKLLKEVSTKQDEINKKRQQACCLLKTLELTLQRASKWNLAKGGVGQAHGEDMLYRHQILLEIQLLYKELRDIQLEVNQSERFANIANRMLQLAHAKQKELQRERQSFVERDRSIKENIIMYQAKFEKCEINVHALIAKIRDSLDYETRKIFERFISYSSVDEVIDMYFGLMVMSDQFFFLSKKMINRLKRKPGYQSIIEKRLAEHENMQTSS
ncbi:hypothetical protein GJ496_002965 [Pomphorhynchus laevis]|nr:hypothetical protein GJ496_002965 [Pomphorhynchus laevis]